MIHLRISNTNYGQMKGRESNCQFDSRPLKVRNRPNFLVWRWHVIYHWKALDEDYNFAFILISIKGLHTKLWAPKIVGVPTLGISTLPLGSPEKKWHLSAGLVTRYRVYYKGEGGGSSSRWWILWIHGCPWLVRAPKCSNYALTNLLFGLCRYVWVNELLVNLLSPMLELQHAFLPSKCCKPGSAPQLLLLLLALTHSQILN
jgi:hypothetical protein